MKNDTKEHIKQLLDLDKKYKAKKRQSEKNLVEKFASIIEYFQNKYNFEPTEMHKTPNKRDLMQFRRLLNELPSDIPSEAKKRVKIYKKMIGIDRRTLLGSMIGLTMIKQTSKNVDEINKEIKNTFINELNRLGKLYNTNVSKLENKVQTVVTKPIGKSVWTDRAWQHHDKATSLTTISISDSIVQGSTKGLNAKITDLVHVYNSGIIANFISESAKANSSAEQMFAEQNQLKMVLIVQPGA